jgi:hypothetical protein
MNLRTTGLGQFVAVLAVAALPVSAAAQELFKCTDGAATTYSSTACEKLGLKPAGPIRDRITVINNPPAPSGAAAAGKSPAAGAAPSGAGNATAPNATAGAAQSAATPASGSSGAGKAALSVEEEEKRARRAAIGIKPVNPLIDRLAR